MTERLTHTHTHTNAEFLHHQETFQTICLLKCKRKGLKHTTTQHMGVAVASQAVA